jgi:carbonic anhydrase
MQMQIDFNLNNIRRFPIELLLPPNAATDFYRYRGSLTTPPCYESVQWTVFRQPLTISADQLEAFRTLLYENTSTTPAELLENNYRPTQPLNGRIVTRSFSNPEAYWTYGTDNGPATWKNTNPMCGWMQQSPINIDTTNTTDKYYDNLKFIGFQSQAGGTRDFNVTNTGHAIELQVGSGFTTSNGGLNGTYTLDKIVFHWGNTASVGSEHTVNSASEPLEIQFVHRQNGYSSIAEASRHEGGLAIVAVFAALSQSTESQTGLNNISNVLPAINTTGGMTTVKSFDLSELLPTNQITFYRYTGSLTSPNCAERVVWTVYSNTISVTVGQAAAFRQTALIGSTVPSSNTRPVQPLNSRVVYRSVLKSNAPFCTGANSAFLLLVALAILAVVFM